MSDLFEGLAPRALFQFFAEISAIPRASSQEAAIAAYLLDFAKARGLFVWRDAANNVLIKKPAAKGREAEPAVLLQAHTDMVAEKHSYISHDFLTEGVALRREGDILQAEGTTLGADDGFGVAVMLAVLDDTTLSHPPLECLFTTEEEIGMGGANAFDYSLLHARYLLNLDSAEEDAVVVGCCGGVCSKITLPVTLTPVSGEGVRLAISGLSGGHSGEDVHRGRANALSLMGRLLAGLREKTPYRIASLSGGDKTNAIPRECEAVLLPEDGAALRAAIPAAFAAIRADVTAAEDAGITLDCTPAPVTAVMCDTDLANAIAVLAIRSGVLNMRETPPIMPAVSRNLANIRTEEGALTVLFSSRAASDAARDAAAAEIAATAKALGGSCEQYSPYSGWEEAFDSKPVRDWQQAYHTVTGKKATPALIHAGLETGVITSAVAGLSAISVGCNIYDLHTPQERMELSSFARIYNTVLEFLRIV